jgi:O-antigen ligase
MGWLWIGLGWLTTGLAMSLGSGFWFDFLGKFMNIRMAGKRETTASASKT